MSSVALESYLARLYTDAAARARFTADPEGEAAQAGLSAPECAALAACDRVGLEMAAESFGHKRARHGRRRLPWHRRVLRWLLRRLT
ncbi:hypothetical protein [Dongia sp.]|uniref:hypothetical protein n=1 Tax=Dongia sp. TaxID=1977262 RepID=UPI0037535E2B